MHIPSFKLISQSMLKKVRKTGTDGRTDGQTDGHCHGIVRPFFKRAYKNDINIDIGYVDNFVFICLRAIENKMLIESREATLMFNIASVNWSVAPCRVQGHIALIVKRWQPDNQGYFPSVVTLGIFMKIIPVWPAWSCKNPLGLMTIQQYVHLWREIRMQWLNKYPYKMYISSTLACVISAKHICISKKKTGFGVFFYLACL